MHKFATVYQAAMRKMAEEQDGYGFANNIGVSGVGKTASYYDIKQFPELRRFLESNKQSPAVQVPAPQPDPTPAIPPPQPDPVNTPAGKPSNPGYFSGKMPKLMPLNPKYLDRIIKQMDGAGGVWRWPAKRQ